MPLQKRHSRGAMRFHVISTMVRSAPKSFVEEGEAKHTYSVRNVDINRVLLRGYTPSGPVKEL